MSEWTHQRAKCAALTRSRAADDPELLDAKRNLRAARLEDYIQRAVDSAPPLTLEQKQRLAALLSGGGLHGAA